MIISVLGSWDKQAAILLQEYDLISTELIQEDLYQSTGGAQGQQIVPEKSGVWILGDHPLQQLNLPGCYPEFGGFVFWCPGQ